MSLASMVVRIGADLTGLNKGLAQMDRDVQRTGKRVASLGSTLTTNLTVPIAAVGAGLVAAAINVGRFADKLLDLVDQTGLSSKTLQEFRHVALAAGVESDTLAKAAIKLTTALSSGGEQTGQMSDALGKLGLKATDSLGRLQSMDVLMPSIIGKLQGMSDTTTRNILAADIFGKSWAELAPILSMGAGAMAKAQQEANALGLVMSDQALQAADDFRRGLDRLQASFSGIVREVGVGVLPIMESLVSILQTDMIPAVRSVVQGFSDLSPTTQIAIGAVAGMVAAIGPLVLGLGTIMTFLPLLKVGFAALTGPIGLAVLAVGSLTLAGVQMAKHWDATKLQFTLAWTAMKDAAFFAISKILDAVAGMAMAFKMTGLAGEVMKLSAELKILADEELAKAGGKISELETVMLSVATAVKTAAGEVTKLGTALEELPAPPSVDYGISDRPNGMFGNVGRDEKEKKSGFGFSPGDRLGTKVSQTMQAGGGGGQLTQMVQAFESFGPMAAILPAINGALEMLAPAFEKLIEPIVHIGRVVGEILAPILEMLAPYLQLVADLFIRQLAPALKGITYVISFVMEAFGWLVRGIGRLVDALPGISAKGVIDAGQAMIDAAEAARRNANAADGATDELNKFASALSNIPRVLNINALRHMVTGTPGGPTGTPPGVGPIGGSDKGGLKFSSGTTNNYFTFTINGATNPRETANMVAREVERVKRGGGVHRMHVAMM